MPLSRGEIGAIKRFDVDFGYVHCDLFLDVLRSVLRHTLGRHTVQTDEDPVAQRSVVLITCCGYGFILLQVGNKKQVKLKNEVFLYKKSFAACRGVIVL